MKSKRLILKIVFMNFTGLPVLWITQIIIEDYLFLNTTAFSRLRKTPIAISFVSAQHVC